MKYILKKYSKALCCIIKEEEQEQEQEQEFIMTLVVVHIYYTILQLC